MQFTYYTFMLLHHIRYYLHTEDSLVVDLFDAEPHPSGEHADKDVKVEEKRHPCRGLMLGHGGDDWNVDFSVTGVP